MRVAALNTFSTLWRMLTPQITVMKPMTDLCWVCQQNSSALSKAANTPEEEKSEVSTPLLYRQDRKQITHFIHKVVKRYEGHLLLATKARSYLKAQVEAAKEALKKHFSDRNVPVPALGDCLPSACNDITIHYSFDMAQQVRKTTIIPLHIQT